MVFKKGYKMTEEHKKNISVSNTGKKRTDKWKKEQSIRTTNFFKSEKGKKQIERLKIICKDAPAVHHLNGNHSDNRLENLIIVTPREHALIHMYQKDIIPFGGNKIRRERLKQSRSVRL